MSKPTKCISIEEAKELQNNWIKSRGATITSSRGAQDASDFTFSLAEMEEFLAYVRAESAKQGVLNPGIRIYFAAYNNSKSTKATVFLAPTNGSDENASNNYDIDPLNRGGSGWPPNDY